MKSLKLLPLFLFFFIALNGQKGTLKGTVVDTLNEPLIGATVMILQAKDSVLTKFGITNKEGQFFLKRLSPDDYILQIAYLGYASISQPISFLNQLNVKDLGIIELLPESAVLDLVEVKADHIPIQFKKDTIEYNAIAFKTRPNAVVEDLLKKLPGVEVGRDGSIKAQGETVQNMLVDGKEFFGNDPKIATKNLPANAIDKVQVFDKKSDIAEFSGIDDGREAKTINLTLKEDKKKGYFGKVKGGYGTDQRYEGKFNVNRFGNNIQISGIGMLNNTNQQGFSINDYINMMGSLNNLLSGGSGSISFNLDSEELGLPLNGGQKNQGFTNTAAGGFNLNWEANKKTKLHTSYFYNKIKRDRKKTETRQSLLTDQSYNSDKDAHTIRENEGHRLNVNLDSKIDSFQTIKWRSSIGYNKNFGTNTSFSQTFNLAEQLENNSNRNYASDGDDFRLNSNFIYLRRFHKKGRFFTGNLAYDIRNKQQDSELKAINNFFGIEVFADSLNQTHEQENKQTNYGVGLSYTEPLGKRKYLEINYSYQNFGNRLIKDVFDKKENRLLVNEQLTNHFQRDYLYNRGGLNFKWNQKKWKLTAGINAQNSSLKGKLILEGIAIEKNFFNVLPKLNFDYDFKAARNLRFTYRTSVREPSLEQLQPIVDNSDPLNIYAGNPELVSEYLHDFRLNFHSFDQFSSISIFGNVNATFTKDKILNAREIDDLFRQTIQPVNFGNNFSLRSYLSFGAPIHFIKSRVNVNVENNYQSGNYLVNKVANNFNGVFTSLDISLSNKNTDIIDLSIGAKLTKNQVKYAVNNRLNQSYLNEIYYTDLAINIGKNWVISSTMDYTRYSAESFGSPIDLPIWQAALSRYVFKNQRGTFKLKAYDILNKNLGINRTNQLNFVQEERIVSLGRYFLLSFTYALSGFGGDSRGGIEFTHRR